MTDKLESKIVREIIELKEPTHALAMVLIAHLAATYRVVLFGHFIASIEPHEKEICELMHGQLDMPQMSHVREGGRELELVYRLAVFDSFLNNLTSYALAARPAKAIGSAQMQASVLLAKSRSEIVNEYISKRTKTLSRETFGTRIQGLRDICEVDFRFNQNDVEELKRLSNLRNAIIHEGQAFQFTVDDNLSISPHTQKQKVNLSIEEFAPLPRLAASLYRQYVTKFIGRACDQLEETCLSALE
jgi:hypothetical protein